MIIYMGLKYFDIEMGRVSANNEGKAENTILMDTTRVIHASIE